MCIFGDTQVNNLFLFMFLNRHVISFISLVDCQPSVNAFSIHNFVRSLAPTYVTKEEKDTMPDRFRYDLISFAKVIF